MAGMYDLGAPAPAGGGQDDMAQQLRMMQMMHAMQGQQGKQDGSPSPLGAFSNGLMSMMLMNPGAFKGGGSASGFGTGLGNLFSGNQWNGMAGAGTMPGLVNQAQGNINSGAAGL